MFLWRARSSPRVVCDLNESDTCVVCLQPRKQVDQLPCLHSFCCACVTKFKRTSTNACPLCRTTVPSEAHLFHHNKAVRLVARVTLAEAQGDQPMAMTLLSEAEKIFREAIRLKPRHALSHPDDDVHPGARSLGR